jgi:hypothetical protein
MFKFGGLQGLASRALALCNGKWAVEKRLETHYLVECRDKNGNLKWTDEFCNLVVTEGLTDSLDKHLKGSAYTAVWYVAPTGTAPVFAAGNTLASHAGWTEVTAYDEAARVLLVLGVVSAGSVNNAASKARFTISTNSTVVGGCFVTSGSAKSGTDGVLYGGGAFTGGDKTLSDDDTLDVTVTLTATAA